MLQAHCLGSQPRFQGVGWCSKPQFPHCGGDAAGGMRIIEHSLAASVPAVPADLGCGTGRLPHQGRACQGHSTLTCPHWGLRGSGSVVLPAPLRAGSCLSRQPLVSISVIPALEHRPPTEGASPQRARGQTAAALRAPGEADVDSCCDATKDCSGRGCPLVSETQNSGRFFVSDCGGESSVGLPGEIWKPAGLRTARQAERCPVPAVPGNVFCVGNDPGEAQASGPDRPGTTGAGTVHRATPRSCCTQTWGSLRVQTCGPALREGLPGPLAGQLLMVLWGRLCPHLDRCWRAAAVRTPRSQVWLTFRVTWPSVSWSLGLVDWSLAWPLVGLSVMPAALWVWVMSCTALAATTPVVL
ncbi:PREDICTED: uncharacterized protein LOC105575316 isoform X1 [Cercocebus atys]|uniref:uncharacterized protein LOC105575316 isoform X1 n=1 Tax=Cercocebus atys TaxID=9531 RepID=UPI0005F49901|nr:PREDICTED: uncharacterized protein LOC105575316 isoform X1 [Cercocebus atys]